MRCKPGDLALVIGGSRDDLGKMVKCIRVEDPPYPVKRKYVGRTWHVDRMMSWHNIDTRVAIPYALDDYLMPIKPEKDDAETDTADSTRVPARDDKVVVRS